ncbi:MAG: fatty acid desaturase [Chitinophagales bacterium]
MIKPIRFVSLHPSEFYETLKTRVNQHFKDKDISRYANSAMMLKTALLLTGYLGGFALLLIAHPALHIALFLWAFMGFCLAGIGMSIMHDANHGAYSKNKQVNYWLGHTLNLLGGSVFNWKLQHNYLHHTFTNIANWDEDIQNKLALRLNPDGAAMPFHRFQYIYAFLLYSIATLYWVIAKDFFQFIRYAKKGINKHNSTENRILFLKMTLAKLVYFCSHACTSSPPIEHCILALANAVSYHALFCRNYSYCNLQLAHTLSLKPRTPFPPKTAPLKMLGLFTNADYG